MMKIFIVDDDPIFVKKLNFLIEATRACDIHIFNTVERAVGQLSLEPDVIFLDHYLPGINGVEVVNIIKEKLPNCKIIVTSSQNDIKVLEKAIFEGAYKYLIKDDDLPKNLEKVFNSINLETERNSDNWLTTIFKFLSNKNSTRKRPKIYVVDDDEVFSFLIDFKLSKSNYFDLETFSRAADAINAIDGKPDLMILDYHLKKSNGAQVLERYKKDCPETKVIIASSQQDINVASDLLNQGADGYIVKGPDVLEKLSKVIDENLN